MSWGMSVFIMKNLLYIIWHGFSFTHNNISQVFSSMSQNSSIFLMIIWCITKHTITQLIARFSRVFNILNNVTVSISLQIFFPSI